MFQQLKERLSYAVIGFVLGTVLAGVLWFLYDQGASRHSGGNGPHWGLIQWVKYVGGGFAVLGFLVKDRVGSAIGGSLSNVYASESYDGNNPQVPRWLAVIVLVGVVVGVWIFMR